MRAGTHRNRAPEETQHGGRNGDPGTEEKGTTANATTHTQEGQTTTEGPAPPHPRRRPHDPRGAHPPTRTAEARMGRRGDHTSAHPPATGNHTGDGGHTYTGRTGHTHRASRSTTTPSPPGDDPGRHKGHLTGTGVGRRHGHSDQG